MTDWERHLERWQQAGIVDAPTASRIHAFEADEARPTGQRWQVLVALIFGGILLGAGVLLFVAAHWDKVSPLSRFGLVLGILAVLHLAAVFATDRFPAMATALHGVGTVGAGAAIALVGQIFNMQEHWPAAILLWAACAAAGWWWLRDQFQRVCVLLLVPAWLICEWSFRAQPYSPASDVYLFRMIAVLAGVYLTAFVHSQRRVVFGILFAVASVGLVIATGVLTEGWGSWYRTAPTPMPMGLRLLAYGLLLLMLAGGWAWERRSLLPTLAVTVVAFALPWLHTMIHIKNEFNGGRDYDHETPSLLSYALVAALTALLAWWGTREHSKALVNYGIAMFALTVVWFYFSSLMDKLGRSLGLIGLGLLFLAGGWLLERMRRRLLTTMCEEVVV